MTSGLPAAAAFAFIHATASSSELLALIPPAIVFETNRSASGAMPAKR